MSSLSTFRSDYVATLQEHVIAGGEATLHRGYELGRRAVAEGVSALDLAALHHEALDVVLQDDGRRSSSNIVTAAGEFFVEILSAFEMVHRGYREAASDVAAERRNAAMLRQLSSFLADASLGARDSDAVAEVVYLVAEHARELTGAVHCVANCTLGAERVRATSSARDVRDSGPLEWLEHLEAAADELPTRVAPSEWAHEPALREALRSSPAYVSILTAPVAALNGRRLGFLQLVDKRSGDFGDVDEAMALHLAEMTAAALERAELYRRGRKARV